MTSLRIPTGIMDIPKHARTRHIKCMIESWREHLLFNSCPTTISRRHRDNDKRPKKKGGEKEKGT